MGDEIREGDIEAIRRSKELEGKPVKSNIVRTKDGDQIFYTVTEDGKVQVDEVV